VSIQIKGITPMFLPGQLIQSVNNHDQFFEIGTVITARTWDFRAGATAIQTGYEELRFMDAGATHRVNRSRRAR